MATISSLTTEVINYLTGKITGSVATSQDIVLQTKALEQLGSAQDLLNAVSVDISASDVDFSAGQVFTKTLSVDTTLTFSNASVGETKDLVITGDFTLTLPAEANIIYGTYDGTVSNLVQIVCTQTGPAVYWVTISQAI
jgi:hypothetical protein